MTFTATDRAKLAAVFTLLGEVKDGQDAQTVILRGVEADQAVLAAGIGQVLAELAEVKAMLQPQEPPPPPPPSKTLWGANVGGWVTAGETAPNAYARIKSGFGALPIVRWWSNGFPSSWAAVPSWMTGFDALCPDFGSDVAGVNAGTYDAAWRNLCETATFPVHCSYAHEPGNKGCTVVDWQAAQVRLAAIKAEVGNPLVTFGPVLMGGTYNPKRYAVADKLPADQWLDFDMTNIDWIGGDHYQWPGDTAAYNLGFLIDAAKSRGKRVLVAETGALPLSKVTDQARADWYTGIKALVDANPGLIVAVIQFESDRGPENPPCCVLGQNGDVMTYSPLAAAVVGSLCMAGAP
jgi:hypothetical protein